MIRIRGPLGAAAAVSVIGAAAALSPGAIAAPQASAARSYTVQAASTKLGKVLVGSNRDLLYVFSADRKNGSKCETTAGCTAVWPPLLAKGKVSAGPGVKASGIGTISIGSGKKQVTYDGHPLYGYVAALGPDNTSYVNTSQFGGKWDAITTAGKVKS